MAGVAGAQTIAGAEFAGPTGRYPHGALGDEMEHDTLVFRYAEGGGARVRFASDMVFEDTAPRLADLDGEGSPEVIVVESHQRRGARLAVWGLREGRPARLAATPFLGQRFRWLAPVGAADLDGDGAAEIAYVETPHLGKTLKVLRYEADGRLTPVAEAAGLTNHRFGAPAISGGLRDCGAGPEILTADAEWRRTVATRLEGGELVSRDLGPVRDLEAALGC